MDEEKGNVDSARTDARAVKRTTLPFGAELAAVIFFVVLSVVFIVKDFPGNHRAPVIINTPASVPPFVFACDHHVKVYTTPQGGIALAPGGNDCP